MTYLIDTHILLWALFSPEKIKPKTLVILEDAAQDIVVSAVSFWEISLKFRLGKLHLKGVLPEDLPTLAERSGFRILQLDAQTASSYHQIKEIKTKDPFDRMLVWQAKKNGFTLISQDGKISL